MKKRNLISVILVVALLLSCSLSVFAAVPPKGETAEPQLAKVLCGRCGTEATILDPSYKVTKTILVSSGACSVDRLNSHYHDLEYTGIRINCPNCGKYVVNLTLIKTHCHAFS